MINIKLNNLGTVNKNRVEIETEKGRVDIYFSYETIVGFNGCVNEPYETYNACSVNDWSTTTGKLLNEIEPDKKARISHDEVVESLDTLLSKIF